MERTGIYRKCRLEEVILPLKKGNLSDIPMDEVGDPTLYIYTITDSVLKESP